MERSGSSGNEIRTQTNSVVDSGPRHGRVFWRGDTFIRRIRGEMPVFFGKPNFCVDLFFFKLSNLVTLSYKTHTNFANAAERTTPEGYVCFQFWSYLGWIFAFPFYTTAGGWERSFGCHIPEKVVAHTHTKSEWLFRQMGIVLSILLVLVLVLTIYLGPRRIHLLKYLAQKEGEPSWIEFFLGVATVEALVSGFDNEKMKPPVLDIQPRRAVPVYLRPLLGFRTIWRSSLFFFFFFFC